MTLAVALLCLAGFVAAARAETVTVTSTNDLGPGSLRQAIADASAGDTIAFDPSLDGEKIQLLTGAIAIDKSLTIDGPGAAQLTIDGGGGGQIFTVTAGDLSTSGLTFANGAANIAPANGGAIEFTGDGSLTITGSTFSGNTAGGPGGITEYSGRGEGGAISYKGAGSLTITASSFEGNAAGGVGGSGLSSGSGSGGAIYVGNTALSVSITGSTFSGNTAGGEGGGGFDSGRGSGGAIDHASGGSLTILESTFSGNTAGGLGGAGNNSATGSGGAVSNSSGSPLTVTASTFNGNAVGGAGGSGSSSGGGTGGAISTSFHAPMITGSTFTGNTVGGDKGIGSNSGTGSGGALYAFASALSISNSTWVGNTAGGENAPGFGGAIGFAGESSATLASVTISGNAVGDGGIGAGINDAKLPGVAFAAVTARATIVSGNTGATNCNAPVASKSYSLEGPSASETSCGFDLPSADPQLQPLADNGGPTETQALPVGSPAVGVVPVAKCPTKVDQRGMPRPDYGKSFCDVGAYELQGPLFAPTITSAAAATFHVGKAGSFTVTGAGIPLPSFSEAGALPSGVGFTDNGNGTASLSGIPAPGTAGIYPITIKASNGEAPDALQSFTLTVQGPPEPPQALGLSLDVERISLPKLLRTRKLVVATGVNKAAKVVLTGKAKLRPRGHRSSEATFVAVFRRKTAHFVAAGENRVTLVLTRRGRRALRHLRKVRLVIAGEATDAAGNAVTDRAALTVRR